MRILAQLIRFGVPTQNKSGSNRSPSRFAYQKKELPLFVNAATTTGHSTAGVTAAGESATGESTAGTTAGESTTGTSSA
jgi:hypothetical protein